MEVRNSPVDMTLIFWKTFKPVSLHNVIYLQFLFFGFFLMFSLKKRIKITDCSRKQEFLKYLKLSFSIIAALALKNVES